MDILLGTTMALPPKFKGHRLLFFSDDPAAPAPTETAASEPLHTIELYLDYVCPFSASTCHHNLM